jgi:hypothetical protein
LQSRGQEHKKFNIKLGGTDLLFVFSLLNTWLVPKLALPRTIAGLSQYFALAGISKSRRCLNDFFKQDPGVGLSSEVFRMQPDMYYLASSFRFCKHPADPIRRQRAGSHSPHAVLPI